MKSENLNHLETSGPLQACNGTAVPFFMLESTDEFSYRKVANNCNSVAVFVIICDFATEDDKVGSSFK